MRPDLRFDQSVLPPFLLLLLLIIVGIWVVRSYRIEGVGRFRRGTLTALTVLRLAAVAAIVFVLLKPILFRLKETTEPGTVVLFVDASESMEISDGPGRRLEVARSAARELAGRLGERFRVRIYSFAAFPEALKTEEVDSLGVRVTGATNIGGSIREGLQAEGSGTAAAAVLLSDGQHNTGPSPREVAAELRQRGIPVFSVGIGAEGAFRDVEVREFSGPRAVFRGEEARLSLRVVNYGFERQEAPFRIRVSDYQPLIEGATGASPAARLVTDRALRLPPPGTEESQWAGFTPETEGIYRLSAEVGPLAGEEVTENNVRELEIEVTRERLRVLLVESTPRWEYGFILRALRTDRRFAAGGLVRLQDGPYRFQGTELNPEHPWAGRRFPPPLHPDWDRLDAVVLGDVPPGDFQLDALAALRTRVEESGMILAVLPGPGTARGGGYDATPLGPMLPFRGLGGPGAGPVKVLPSLSGANHPALRLGAGDEGVMERWGRLFPLWAIYPVRETVPGSVVLAEAEVQGRKQPVAAYRRAGNGKVLQLAVDDTWRWRVEAGGGEAGGSAPLLFWRQMMRWLITGRVDDPGAGVRVLVERSTFNRGERVDIEARADIPPRLEGAPFRLAAEMVLPDGFSEPIGMSALSRRGAESGGTRLYRHSYVPLEYGAYRVRVTAAAGEEIVGRDEATFFVTESGLERARTSLDRTLLQDIAAITGGRYFSSGDFAAVADAIPERDTIRVEPATTRLWDSPVIFLLFAGCVAAEWFLRKWNDLA